MVAKSNSDARKRAEKQLLRRARTAVKNDLAWLRGMPLAVDGKRSGWLACPSVGLPYVVEVDGARLSRAFRTLTFITKRHPQLVEHPDSWVQGIQGVLGHLQRLVHEDQELPNEVIDQLKIGRHAKHRALSLLITDGLGRQVEEASWLHVTEPNRFPQAVGLIESEAAFFRSLGRDEPDLARRLLLIGIRNGYAIPAPLQRIVPLRRQRHIVDPAPALNQTATLLRQIKNGRFDDGEELPDTAKYQVEFLQDGIDRFTSDVLKLSDDVFREVFFLIGLVLADGIAEPKTDLGAGDEAVEDSHRRAMGFVRRVGFEQKPSASPSIRTKAVKLAQELESLAANQQPNQLLEVWKWARYLPKAYGPRLGVICRRLLPLVATKQIEPEVVLTTKLAITRYWTPSKRHGNRFEPMVASQRELLLDGIVDWSTILSGPANGHGIVDRRLLRLTPADRAASLRVLAQLAVNESALIAPILSLTAAGASPERAHELAQGLSKHRETVEQLDHKVLTALLDGSSSAMGFRRIIEALDEISSLWEDDAGLDVPHLLRLWSEYGLGIDEVMADPVDGLIGRQLRLCQRLRLLNVDGDGASSHDVGEVVAAGAAATSVNTPASQSWQARYPERFHSQLKNLVLVGVDPDEVAQAVLGKSYPDRQERRHQLDALGARIAAGGPAHLVERRAGLLHGKSLAERDVARLERKLRRRIVVKTMEALHRALKRSVDQRLAVQFGLNVEGLDPVHHKMVDSVGYLPEPYRAAAMEIVASRLQGEKQDWRRFEANVGFAKLAAAAGVDLAPWNTSKVRARLVAEPTIALSLETDPYEVLQMGRPFGTCLAPGNFNFWSAVVNAVDANKAVLVGRNPAGEMVARCLLALDKNFLVVAYHPYAHQKAWDFTAAAAAVIKDLAAEMGTVVAPSGQVQEIVFQDWYDDGPVDLHGQLRFTEPDSEFMAKVPTASVAELIGALDETGCRAENYVPNLLRAGTFSSRPELVAPVLTRLGANARLPFGTWHDLARNATKSTDSQTLAAARAIVHAHVAPEYVSGRWNLGQCCSFLADLDPILALRIIRRTRATGVRRDEDEVRTIRRTMLASAHRNLGRERKAERLAGTVGASNTG